MKSDKTKYYKMKREDGEVFEIKENIVPVKKNQGYELVDEDPIIRDINTSQNNAQKQEVQREQHKQEEGNETKEESDEENEEEPSSIDDLSYNQLQSFVSDKTEEYTVVGKSTEELAQKAKELVD